jgi:hypothetical protein
MRHFFLLLALPWLASLALASDVTPSPQANGDASLAPFHVQYRLYVSKIPTTIKADLWLRQHGDQPNEYQMEMLVKSLLVSNREVSTFQWDDCQPRTSFYQHRFRGFGKRRNYDMHFSWSPPQVVTETEDERWTLDIEQDTLDDLTLLLKARCTFATGDKEFHATSAYGKRVREHHMQVIGMETLDTPIGKLDCLLVEKQRDKDSERKTLFWVAPSLNYLLIKAKHIENRALFGELILREYDGPMPTQPTVAQHQQTGNAE